jgi:hypothetical protein
MANQSNLKAAQSDEIRSVSDITDDPAFAPFADEIAVLLDKKDQILNLKSYLLAQQGNISQKIELIRKTNPSMPLKNVVTKIFNDLPENISSEMLLLLTRFTISTWENTDKASVKAPAL